MHRFIVASAITAIALLAPGWATASNTETAQQIAQALKQSGRLHNYDFGVKFKDGTAWLIGRVGSEGQKTFAAEMVERFPEVSNVVNQLEVAPAVTTAKHPARLVAATPISTVAMGQPVVRAAAGRGIQSGTVGAEGLSAPPTVDSQVQATAGEQEMARDAQPARLAPMSRTNAVPRIALRRRQNAPSARSASRGQASRGQAPRGQAPLAQAASSEAPRGQAAAIQIPSDQAPRAQAPRAQAPRAQAPRAQATRAQPSRGRSFRGQGLRNNQVARVQPPRGQAPQGSPQPLAQIAPVAGEQEQPRGPQGQQVHLIPMVQGPNGALIPLESMQGASAARQTSGQTAGRQLRRRPFGFRTASAKMPTMDPESGGPSAPMPAYLPTSNAGAAPTTYDQPHMPNYSWPSYASYPNYAGLTYPKQYSPTAWPYIGPFYPYPQVPLGWRKVSLEWDDGWWFLDFDDQN